MYDPATILIAERALERLVTAIFAGISLILGWNLFRVGILDHQRAEAAWHKWSVKLINVGPGVFFALFGTVVFGLLASRPIDVHYLPSAPSASVLPVVPADVPVVSSIHGANSPLTVDKADISPDDSRGITTVLGLLRNRHLVLSLNPAEDHALAKGLTQLERLQKRAAFGRYPSVADHYDEWGDKVANDGRFLSSLSIADQEQFKSMHSFLNDSYLTEVKP